MSDRRYEGPERRSRESGSVTWKWVAVTLMSLSTIGGGGWLTWMAQSIAEVKKDQDTDRQETLKLKGKVDVIEERTKRTEQDVKEIKEDTKEQNRKLDELLRRTR